MTENNIDLVYLWVDGNDPQWVAKKNTFLGNDIQPRAIAGRYDNNDELKYSLRSVEKYLPWIRKIFIVTDRQLPYFIDINHPKITIIDHTEIIPQQYLPVFNSVVIEYFIHKIPDLSEQFLLANDDCFVNQELSPDFFFKGGLPIVRMMFTPLQRIEFVIKKALKIEINDYRLSIENASKQVQKKYGKYFTATSHHNIDAYLKSEYQLTIDTFYESLSKIFSHRFRNKADIQRILLHYDTLARGRGHLKYVSRKESCRIRVQSDDYNKYIKRYNPKLFCLNDTDRATPENRKEIIPFLERLYPHKSSFEK